MLFIAAVQVNVRIRFIIARHLERPLCKMHTAAELSQIKILLLKVLPFPTEQQQQLLDITP